MLGHLKQTNVKIISWITGSAGLLLLLFFIDHPSTIRIKASLSSIVFLNPVSHDKYVKGLCLTAHAGNYFGTSSCYSAFENPAAERIYEIRRLCRRFAFDRTKNPKNYPPGPDGRYVYAGPLIGEGAVLFIDMSMDCESTGHEWCQKNGTFMKLGSLRRFRACVD